MARTAPAALALAAALSFTGCSNDDSGTDVPLENAAEACAAVKAWWARVFAECNGITEALTNALVQTDAGMQCDDWSGAVAEGTTTYDREMAIACLDQLGALTCNQIAWASATGAPFLPYECTLAMRGSLAANASCTNGFECTSGICDFPLACDAPGVCVAAPGLNAGCASVAPFCADGLVCDAGTCVPRDPLPAPVAVSGDCTSAPCVDAAYCRTPDRTCVARQSAGTTCSAPAPCAYGYHCAADFTCQATAQPGEACTFGENDCAFGANCVTNATMAPGTACQSWGVAGARCGIAIDLTTFDIEVVGCLDSWCDVPSGVQGTCTAYTAVGGVCEATTGECGPNNGYRCADDGTSTLRCEQLYCNPT